MPMTRATTILKASGYYSDLLASFSCRDKLEVDLSGTAVSEAIYFHLCKMKLAGWRHRIEFNRGRKHSISDFFQDIVAFYLRASLPGDHIVELERKIGNTQPDIAVKRNEKYVFLIEAKTNIGWDRPDEMASDPYRQFRDRIAQLSRGFEVRQENIIYVFEEHSNVSREFSARFWDGEEQIRRPRPIDFPLSRIFPLFNATDPYYWKHSKGISRYPRASPWHFITQAKLDLSATFVHLSPSRFLLLCLVSSGHSVTTFTHVQARGTLPFGFLEKKNMLNSRMKRFRERPKTISSRPLKTSLE